MTESCYKPQLHLYELDRSLLSNIWAEPLYNCQSSFLLATDLRAVVLGVGTAMAAAIWNRKRILAVSLLLATIVAWAGFITFEAGVNLGEAQYLRYENYGKYKEIMLEMVPKLRAAVVQQSLFELLAFLALPFLFVRICVRVFRGRNAASSNRVIANV